MTLLTLGLAAFILVHLLPCFPLYRARLVNLFGLGIYRGLFSFVSVVGVVLMVFGLKSAEYVQLYQPPIWSKPVTFVLMYFGLYLFFSSTLGSAPSSAKVLTAHPMTWGVVVWCVAHLLSNGDLAHVLLFCSLLIYSFIVILSGNWRGLKPISTTRPKLYAEVVYAVVILLLYMLLAWGHQYFTGMPLW